MLTSLQRHSYWLSAAVLLLFGCVEPVPREKGFLDVSAQVGLEEVAGEYGALWADLDGDDWLDLVFLNHGIPSLYFNQSGQAFVNRAHSSGLKLGQWTYPQQGDRHGGSCADYDNDGDVDLFITHGAMRGETLGVKQDELLNNRGDGTFQDVTLEAGTLNSWGRARLGTWADYDGNGWLDLFVGNFESASVLYRNQEGVFSDVTQEMNAGFVGPLTAWADYDQDGDSDVLVAWPLKLLRNPGRGPFQDSTAEAGLDSLPPELYPYSLAWGDADNDGDLDIFFGSRTPHHAVYLNHNGQFSPGVRLTLEADEKGAGSTWGDVDNDGDLDLLLASTHRLRLYLNRGEARFAAPIVLLEQQPILDASGQPTLGDFDGDGYLDVAIDTATHHVLLRNTRSENSWTKILLQGKSSNRSGFGARVWLWPGGESSGRKPVYREYWGDTGIFKSMGCGPVHAGLGSASHFDLRIVWPSGRLTTLKQVPANRMLEVVEP